jgi:pimeloyl-ACP methyl ester carboxylesterase
MRLSRTPVRAHVPERQPVTTIEANGLRFSALEWGRGPLVLLLHGFPDSAHTWDRIGPEIAQAGYRVVAPFLRGYAPSGLPARDADIRTLGEDIIAIIDALGADRARVIGHDWGAEALYAAAALAPQRIEQMIAIAIPHRARITPTPRLVWALRHFFTFKLPGAARRFARNDYAGVERLYRRWSPTWRYTAEDLDAAKNVLAAPGGLDAVLGYYRAARFRMPAFQRAPVTVPTLCIAGADDPNLGPAEFEAARAQFAAGYTVATIPGGHFCHRESPEACLAAIVPFFAAGDTPR